MRAATRPRGYQRDELIQMIKDLPARATRTFQLGAGHATRTFTFGEQNGVIVRNQLTVRHGVRVVVDAHIPDVAGATFWSGAARTDPSLSCRRDGALR